jgi:DNA modification methylase
MSSPIRYSTSPALWVAAAQLYKGECLQVLRTLPADSVSACITDPQYGLSDVSSADTIQALTAWASGDRERVPDGRGFMGNEWDRFVPPPAVWDECFRVLKPGGYMAVFAGSRTADLMGLSIRLAGFRMCDTITWMYASGMPKGLNISKAIDKAGISSLNNWDGWNTTLKPAAEPIIIAQKPVKGTIINNVLKHGTGGMNIDGCRVPVVDRNNYDAKCASVVGLGSNRNGAAYGEWSGVREDSSSAAGRWPANVMLSHSENCDMETCVHGCPVAALDQQSGSLISGKHAAHHTRTTAGGNNVTHGNMQGITGYSHNDSGGASRFYNIFRYQAKAPKSERPVINGIAHPTVKPLALIEHLITLFTPPYGVVLDPFAGTGTTGHAALRLGFNSIIIERDKKYWPLIDKRLNDYIDTAKVKAS